MYDHRCRAVVVLYNTLFFRVSKKIKIQKINKLLLYLHLTHNDIVMCLQNQWDISFS